jgi:cell division protein FtsW
MIKQQTRVRLPLDLWLFGFTLLLIVIGLWMVFDSSYAKTLDSTKLGHDAFYFLKKQAFGAVLGIAAMFGVLKLGYARLRSIAVPLMFVSIVLLCFVWIPHVGIRQNNANRWINLGFIQFQPSELTKLALVLYIARLLSRPKADAELHETRLGPPLFMTAIAVLLIEREPDLGTAAVLFVSVMTQLFLAGARKRHLAAILGAVALLGAFVLLIGMATGKSSHASGYRAGRITTFLHPDADKKGNGYQVFHSRLAVGSGGWTGMGFGQGKEKLYLPQANTDFIAATVAEETGFAGMVTLLTLLLVVGWRGFHIAYHARERFGALLAGGIVSLICWQALVNIAVATASIPATGVPLPFISFGSSSLIFLLTGIGILLSIAQHGTAAPKAAGEQK